MGKKFLHFFGSEVSLEFFGISYLKKWALIGVLIGVVAGFGSVAFFLLLQVSAYFFLGLGAGYAHPHTDVITSTFTSVAERPWMFPLIAGAGGLIVGILTTRFAPESAGHGTEAAIDAFHNKKGNIRARIPLLKAVTAAITIGSGGSGGREGPTAQIAAGFGSVLSRILKLSVEDRRIALAVGLGAGIGCIFKAPLGAALLSTEIFYRRDFEVKALMPALIASVIGFSIFGTFFGWEPIFKISESAVMFDQPLSLIMYAVVGVCCAGVGIVYVNCFYKVQYLFQKLKIPRFIKPAIGGVLVGIIAMFLPQVLGGGYGWLQVEIFDEVALSPLWILIAILFLKILATSLSIGSGGSAGVFGPGLVIGGFLGAIVGSVFHSLDLFTDIQISTIAIVSMVAFFGAVSKAPISTIVMGSEMTGGFILMPAMMVATFVAYVMIGLKTTLYKSQPNDRSESPAHRKEYHHLLKKLSTKDSLNTNFNKISNEANVEEAIQILKNSESDNIIIVNQEKYVGFADLNNLIKTNENEAKTTKIFPTVDVPTIDIHDSLYDALKKISNSKITELPVVKHKDTLLGTISLSDIFRAYDLEVESLEEDDSEDEQTSGYTK